MLSNTKWWVLIPYTHKQQTQTQWDILIYVFILIYTYIYMTVIIKEKETIYLRGYGRSLNEKIGMGWVKEREERK